MAALDAQTLDLVSAGFFNTGRAPLGACHCADGVVAANALDGQTIRVTFSEAPTFKSPAGIDDAQIHDQRIHHHQCKRLREIVHVAVGNVGPMLGVPPSTASRCHMKYASVFVCQASLNLCCQVPTR